MPIELNTEDIRKLHAEINQILNQRFLITTLAITLFGVVGAWLVPKQAQPGSDVGAFVFLGSMLLLAILGLLFIFSHRHLRIVRTLSAYLIEKQQSGWEKDWQDYNLSYGKYGGYSRAHTTIFAFLGLLALFYPIGMGIALRQGLAPRRWLWLNVLSAVAYFGIILLFRVPRTLKSNETERSRWRTLLKDKSSGERPDL